MMRASSKLPTISRYPYIWPTYTPHLLLSPLTYFPSPQDESTVPPMVSMTSRNSDSTGTESNDPDIRMAYQSITLQGSLNWSVLAPLSRSFLLAHTLKIGSFLLTERLVSR